VTEHGANASPSPPAGPAPDPAWRSRGAWIWFLAAVALLLAIDLGTKYLAFAFVADAPVAVDRADVTAILRNDPRALQALIPRHEPVVVAPHLLEFKLVLNPGAVFGTGAGMRWFFVGFTFVALAFATLLFARMTTARDRLTHLAIALIVSGGLGNLYDRLRYACVRDFIHPLPGVEFPFGITWPNGDPELWPYVSNVADAFLLVGIAILMIRLWNASPESPAKGPEAEASALTDGPTQS
jgi:lipoprotein signal peptidase